MEALPVINLVLILFIGLCIFIIGVYIKSLVNDIYKIEDNLKSLDLCIKDLKFDILSHKDLNRRDSRAVDSFLNNQIDSIKKQEDSIKKLTSSVEKIERRNNDTVLCGKCNVLAHKCTAHVEDYIDFNHFQNKKVVNQKYYCIKCKPKSKTKQQKGNLSGFNPIRKTKINLYKMARCSFFNCMA